MIVKEQLLPFLKEKKICLHKEHSVNKVDLFGSFAVGESKAGSDIDILVLFTACAYDLSL
jgi:predicted nucleotidyltransferase